MAPPVIENPILNSPFDPPSRHFRFDDEGITNEIVEKRRRSAYFVPIAQPRARGAQRRFEEMPARRQENADINRIRDRVDAWRSGGYVDVTPTTRRLLEYWSDAERAKPLFFCQREAVETVIYLTEVATKYGDAWIANRLKEENAQYNAGLPRVAFKMATGSGKTVVMAMMIAWQALNKIANKQDARFSDAFLIVTPGITIRDRLRVLLPSDPGNYYRERDLLPPDLMDRFGEAHIVVTNYHAFLPREKGDASRLAKSMLGAPEAFKESADEMARRVCRDLAGRRNIIVINDEAHHCYWSKPDAPRETLDADERAEAKQREQDARVWSSGLEAVQRRFGIRAIYDLSATPFFLSGSGYGEGTLFPWVVSDFSLIDAIESGIVKIPRVPVAAAQMDGPVPRYRNLWASIREGLPSARGGAARPAGQPRLPTDLEAALHSLYGHYRKAFEEWEANTEARAAGLTSPVFVVVCANVSISKLVFDYVAGWETGAKHPDGAPVVAAGALELLNNEDHGRWGDRPVSILVDSAQLESEEGMSPEFKKSAAAEIEEFKREYRIRFPGRSVDDLTDEDLLREVMNTVGKPGKLGERVRCVVSVSMLTEGWDANTVTHILGVRAFRTQLLSEQVVGRGLRRMSYAVNEEGKFDPEYAEVYGVPFSFIPVAGEGGPTRVGPQPTRVRALEEREALEITFPRVAGYRYEFESDRLGAAFTNDSQYSLSSSDVALWVETAPIVGETSIHTLDDLKARRLSEVAFRLAKLTLDKYFPAEPFLFPQLLPIAKRWLRECVRCKDDAFPQLLLMVSLADDASDRIYRAIVHSVGEGKRLIPMLHPYDVIGTTRYVDFDTTKPTLRTRADKCHVSHVVADTGSWEQKVALALESMEEVLSYVKNQGLHFVIPYSMNGEDRAYYPDFIAIVGQGFSPGGDINLIIEVSGRERKDKANKVATARQLWVPAVNNHGGFGRWGFVEITDPDNAKTEIRAAVEAATGTVGAETVL